MSKSTKQNTKNHSCLSAKEAKALQEDMKRFGYLLPTSDEELEAFENIFGTTKVMLPAQLKNSASRTKKKASSESNLMPVKETATGNGNKKKAAAVPVKKITANAYFKKLILAAEITTQLHKEYSFGHIKFVKLQYLCDQVSNIELESNYRKFAAGPLDPKLIYSIDAEFKKRKWFSVTKTNFGYRYAPDINSEDYKTYYLRYFGDVQDKINYIINLFRREKSDFCELVATIFAIWKEHLEKNKPINNSTLAKSFYAWSPEKKRFKSHEITDAINWMKNKSLTPNI